MVEKRAVNKEEMDSAEEQLNTIRRALYERAGEQVIGAIGESGKKLEETRPFLEMVARDLAVLNAFRGGMWVGANNGGQMCKLPDLRTHLIEYKGGYLNLTRPKDTPGKTEVKKESKG